MEVQEGLKIKVSREVLKKKCRERHSTRQLGMLPGLQPSGSSVDALESVHGEYTDVFFHMRVALIASLL